MEDRLVLRMRRMLGEWLSSEVGNPQQLINWLQGYDLPPVGHEEDSYQWLLRGLPLADERYKAETELATRVAIVLDDKPDKKRPGDAPDELLYNLFMLCAGLSCPDQLAEPLNRVFKRGVLKGEWLGIDLRNALQTALILNQKSLQLQPVWEAMITERSHHFLPGDEYTGFDGIRFMPESEAKRGHPSFNTIGKALKVMAEHLEYEEHREAQFQALINKVIDTYPRPTWNIHLFYQSQKNQWPEWATQNILEPYTDYVYRSIRSSPYPSLRALGGVFTHALTEIKLWMRDDDPSKATVEQAHEELLRTLTVGV